MLKDSLLEIFERDINKLKDELVQYKNEDDLWVVKNEISNSAGTLFLHLIGNLNHFIGATLGNSGYVRNRDLEFSDRNVPREKIAADLDKTLSIVVSTLQNLPEEKISGGFPLEKHGKAVTTDYMLLHLLTHLNYHLGQINYHRRLLES